MAHSLGLVSQPHYADGTLFLRYSGGDDCHATAPGGPYQRQLYVNMHSS